MLYKKQKTQLEKDIAWKAIAKSFIIKFKSTCWCCDVVDSGCNVYLRNFESTSVSPKIDEVLCLCPQCYKAINRLMFDTTDFIIMANYLKQNMFKNDNNRILTYSQVKDYKETYLNEQIELYKKTKDADLQHKLIKKVLSLPV